MCAALAPVRKSYHSLSALEVRLGSNESPAVDRGVESEDAAGAVDDDDACVVLDDAFDGPPFFFLFQ